MNMKTIKWVVEGVAGIALIVAIVSTFQMSWYYNKVSGNLGLGMGADCYTTNDCTGAVMARSDADNVAESTFKAALFPIFLPLLEMELHDLKTYND